MKSIFYILIKPNKGLEILDNEFEDNLLRKSVILFALYAFTKYLFDFTQGKLNLGLLLNSMECLLRIGISIVFGIFFGYFLYKTGKYLGGKGSFIEILAVFAHSYLPIIIYYLLLIYFYSSNLTITNPNIIMAFDFLFLICCFINLRILLLGFVKYHQFKILKALLCILPFFLLELALVLIFRINILQVII